MKNTILIKTGWDEVNLAEYLTISEIEFDKTMQQLTVNKAVKLIALLSDKTEPELMGLSNEMFVPLLEKISFISKDPPKKTEETFKIGDVEYMFNPEHNKLTAGEMISIEQMLVDASEEGRSFLPDILSVLIRPVKRTRNQETGKDVLTLEEFNAETLEERKALFMEKLFVTEFINELTAFINGSERFELISRLSSQRATEIKNRLRAELTH